MKTLSAPSVRPLHATAHGKYRYRATSIILGLALSWQTSCLAIDRAVAIATSGSSVIAQPRLFVAGFSETRWTGSLVARSEDGRASASIWSAEALLDSRSDRDLVDERVVLTFDLVRGGIPFQWMSLTPAQKALFDQDAAGESLVAYVRGERRNETSNAKGIFRPRSSRLGDIVNSNIWHVGDGATHARTPMVYVGANDGLLHGFSAEDGQEKLAYVPLGLQPRLSLLGKPGYQHEYFVDGAVFSGEARIKTKEAPKTFLIGALGSGGKGFFALDVTDPKQFTAANAAIVVQSDLTAGSDEDIGHIFAAPVLDGAKANSTRQIVRMNNGRWAAVLGNGYFSGTAAPILLIQYLDDLNRDKTTGARELLKISACAKTKPCPFQGHNGLSAPQLIDVNGDGMVDLAYAGDLQGNLWKFDLSGPNKAGEAAGAWHVAFSGQPFFVARTNESLRQAITTAPHWMPHPLGGIMIAIGTGRNLEAQDRSSRTIDSIYALRDDSAMRVSMGSVKVTDSSPIQATDSDPRPSTLVRQTYAARVADSVGEFRQSSAQPVAYTGPLPKRGWFIDLPLPGQRVLHNPRGFEGQKIIMQSTIPELGEKTQVIPRTAGESYISVLNMFSGQPSAQPVFALPESSTAVAGLSMARVESGTPVQQRRNGQAVLKFPNQRGFALRTSTTAGARAGWREHQ